MLEGTNSEVSNRANFLASGLHCLTCFRQEYDDPEGGPSLHEHGAVGGGAKLMGGDAVTIGGGDELHTGSVQLPHSTSHHPFIQSSEHFPNAFCSANITLLSYAATMINWRMLLQFLSTARAASGSSTAAGMHHICLTARPHD